MTWKAVNIKGGWCHWGSGGEPDKKKRLIIRLGKKNFKGPEN